ncbi:MAG TPA: aminoacetone oxidase family FAD-binding enzyme [Candidatus Avanaerovorax faecigallinarum]|nr:aminoacetone oxidase family FAD-binding enzyme [Candidatus Avanaerovorax faecigallinarum]
MNSISDERRDICIIGGGASGLAAAVEAGMAGFGHRVILLEKRRGTGSKICASGNGRCNLSNETCHDVRLTLEFFGRIGVLTRTDEAGRIYPYSEEAADVERALRTAAERLGVAVLVNTAVTGLEKDDGGFTVTAETTRDGKKEIRFIPAKKVLVATGGKAAPKLGTTGDGYTMARKLGHRVNSPVPVLTAIEVTENVSVLSGVREKARASLFRDGKCIFCEDGEVQFTRDSLSGICIFNMSRFLKLGKGKTLKDGFKEYEIYLDFMPEFSPAQVEDFLREQGERGLRGESALNSVVKEKLARAVAERIFSDENPARQMKALKFTPKMPKGWETAQVTRGGVALSEVDGITMESKKVPGLYFAGEVLDYDGPCGGFNLNHAWITGIKAGRGLCTEFSR